MILTSTIVKLVQGSNLIARYILKFLSFCPSWNMIEIKFKSHSQRCVSTLINWKCLTLGVVVIEIQQRVPLSDFGSLVVFRHCNFSVWAYAYRHFVRTVAARPWLLAGAFGHVLVLERLFEIWSFFGRNCPGHGWTLQWNQLSDQLLATSAWLQLVMSDSEKWATRDGRPENWEVFTLSPRPQNLLSPALSSL